MSQTDRPVGRGVALPGFETRNLASEVEALSPDEINVLPFGAIRLDATGHVDVFNHTEARLSGYGERPAIGRSFFTEIAPCMNNAYFMGRVERALEGGTLDIAFSFIGDFSDSRRELSVRVQSAQAGGMWIFIRRAAA